MVPSPPAMDGDFGAGSRAGYRIDEHRVELLDSTKDLATGNNPFREMLFGDGGGRAIDIIGSDHGTPAEPLTELTQPHPGDATEPGVDHPPGEGPPLAG